MSPARVYYPALDGLRALAFLMVFAQHYGDVQWGWSGVDIFFVLSGFLITGILLRTQDRPQRYRTFYLRRVLRIFPLYYGVFLLLLLLTRPLRLHWNALWFFWVFHLGNYLRNWPDTAFGGRYYLVDYGMLLTSVSSMPILYLGHFWSLCVEEQFYLIWPVVVFTVRSRQKLMALGLGLFAVMPLIRWGMEYLLPLDAMHGLMGWAAPFRADSMLLGSAIAIWIQYPSGHRAMHSTLGISLPFATGILIFSILRLTHYDFKMPPAGHIATYTIVDAMAAILVFEAIRPASIFSKALQWRPLMLLGGLSYGAYIFHDIPHTLYQTLAGKLIYGDLLGGHLQHHRSAPGVLTMMIALAATYLLAFLSYRFYESRFLRLKDRLAPDASLQH